MILDYMRTTSENLAGGWQFPQSDVTIVTGWGMHSRGKIEQTAVIRDVTLRFLQVCLPFSGLYNLSGLHLHLILRLLFMPKLQANAKCIVPSSTEFGHLRPLLHQRIMDCSQLSARVGKRHDWGNSGVLDQRTWISWS
jgi:hypothetical protein